MFSMASLFNRPKIYPLKSLLAPGNRVALFASPEETDRFFSALELFQLSAFKASIVAIISNDPAEAGEMRRGLPTIYPRAMHTLDLDFILITNKMDGKVLEAEAVRMGHKKPRCVRAWQWTFADSVNSARYSGILEKTDAANVTGSPDTSKAHHQTPRLTEAVTMKALLDASQDRTVDDILEGFSDPEHVRRHLDQILWISPREPHPFLGEQLASGRHFNCHINQLHMRGKREVTMPKPSGTLRIFVVGASTAFGAGAPGDGQIIGAYIEKYLARHLSSDRLSIEVFTAATPQWTSTHERIVIENRVSRLSPDLVISISGAADIFWTCKGQTVFNVASDWFREYVIHFNRYLDMLDLPRVNPYPREKPSMIPMEQMAGDLIENLRQSAFSLEQVDCPILFALQPALIESRKIKSRMESENVEKFEYRCSIENIRISEGYKHLRHKVPRAKIPNLTFIDLSGVFDDVQGETVFLDTFHFGDKGNRIIGRALADRVISENHLRHEIRF